jgi:hypothetical protein
MDAEFRRIGIHAAAQKACAEINKMYVGLSSLERAP